MRLMLIVLVLSNLAWFIAFAVAMNTRRRRSHSVHLGGTNYVTIEGYSAKQTAKLLELVEETRE